MLIVKNLGFYYRKDRVILENISFEAQAGDILCLLGPNGTGKTTLLRCLLGLLKPKSGEIRVDGRDCSRLPARLRAPLLAYVPQSSGITFPYETGEVIMMGRIAYLPPGQAPAKQDYAAARDAMDMLGITRLEHRFYQELSGGERQMALIARALAQQAKVLVMDEPTASLDYGNQVKTLRMAKSLAARGYAIVMSSHSPDHALWVRSQTALMRDGSLFARGPPDNTITDANLSELYQTPVRVFTINEGPGDGKGNGSNDDDSEQKVCVPQFATCRHLPWRRNGRGVQ
ncbi:MAG: ABC transporter ATP-binding protein [Spirochaetaceae bacterium]|jgi:iron complex transport system ATP-binding protein|nr:ABC transporter ATP-binding protein [Spirochaetaceae bacterium]